MEARLTLSTGLLGLALISPIAQAVTASLTSPNEKLQVLISDDDGVIRYQVKFAGQSVIQPSGLGLEFTTGADFKQSLSIAQQSRNAVDETWQQPWGERKVVRDHHNELSIRLKTDDEQLLPYSLRFRAFDDGVAFRYESEGLADDHSVEITDEDTEFNFSDAENITSWWVPAMGWNRYEYLYKNTPMSDVDRVTTPFTFVLPDGVHVSIHEAALVDYAEMTLDQKRSGHLKAALVPRSDGLKVKRLGNFVTPWRTIQIAEDAVGLLNSDLILNLNEPNVLGDVSWVEPGKYIGIWWGMHLGVNTWGSGEKHGATTERTKAFMDFAAKYGFDGVLVEGWNQGWDGSWFDNGDVFSFTETYPDFDFKAVTDYGAKKGVRLIGHHETSGSISNYEQQMADAYALYEKHGVRQVKTGYVADGGDIKRIDEQGQVRHEWHGSQHMVNHYLHSVKEAAKHKISINTHEPVKDTGLRRTYPNWLAREGARGQEFNAWGSPPNDPAHAVNLVYTRMLAGPMDFTPGIFNLAFEGLDAENRVQTTLAKQLALYVVLYSPIQMAADLLEHYEARMDAFQFIRDVPVDWEHSRALAGEVGDYVVFARQERDAEDWYLGAITDENARELKVSLDFLSPGKSYEAQMYLDGENADWKSAPYEMKIENRTVSSKDTLTLPLATSGGAAIRFKAQ